MIDLKGRREVCWDEELIESSEGVTVAQHKPIRKNIALVCDDVWEGVTCGYPSVMRVGDKYRFYYRASGQNELAKGESFCVAVSDDGKVFTKPKLGMYEYGEAKNTNIHHMEERFIDNFTVHYDINPDCPAEEKFKALSLVLPKEGFTPGVAYIPKLALYTSPDGLKFKYERILPIKGVFDTHNVLLWDEKNKIYRIYMRDFHNEDGSECTYEPTEAMDRCIRDVRLTTSKDLVEWTVPERIRFEEGTPDYQLYTNQIIKYPRADVYVGMPARYADRRADKINFKHLSDHGGWRRNLLEKGNRIGSAMTDCVLMFSRDGFNFKRDDNAFLSPAYEEGRNWYYGDCYVSHGIVETVSDENPDVTEYSFYTGEGYRQRPIEFVRYAIRLDGFYSWHADCSGGTLMTKPMTLGETLEINFSTSALGGVRIVVCDDSGKAINGYDSGVLFGNSTARSVNFEKPLAKLEGKAVRLKIELCDADVYSFCSEL